MFIWGTVTSSLRAEGAAPAADWSRWEQTGQVPRSGDGNGFATNYREEFEMLAAHGLNAVRLGVEWARIEPINGKRDTDEIDRYRDILAAARSVGLAPWVTLVHDTLPGWLADDEGGFVDDRVRTYLWPRHVDVCAEAFDGLIAGWVPIDDPIGRVMRSHFVGAAPPGLTLDAGKVAEAARAALYANHEAWRLLGSGDAPVMAVFGIPTLFPADESPQAREQRQWWEDMVWPSWIGALEHGEVVFPGIGAREVEGMAGSFDLVGLRFDHPIAIDRDGQPGPYPADARLDDRGYAPLVEEFGEALHRAADQLPGRPLVIAGNGVSTTDDDWRDELLKGTLRQLDIARREDLDVRGYFHDCGVDGYEHRLGYTTERGLFARNRSPKESARSLAAHISDD